MEFRDLIDAHTKNDALEWIAAHLNTSKDMLVNTYLSDVYPNLLTGCFLCVALHH